MPLQNIWKRWAKNEDGSFAAMMAVIVLAIVLTVGFVVDTHNMRNKQQRLQSVSDAIVLKAFQSGERSQNGLNDIAADYLRSFYSAEEFAQISVADIRREDDEVSLILSQDLDNDPGFFLPRNDVNVSVSSNAGNAGERINFALVLDTTGSMANHGRIEALMAASNRLVDQLQTVDNDQFRVSVVPFGRFVNVGINNQNAPWLDVQTTNVWNGCVGSRLGSAATSPGFNGNPLIGVAGVCGSEVLPLTRNLGAVRTKVNSLTTGGLTYLPSGIMWGWRTLEASQPFTEAQATFAGGQTPRKVMLFMTDGANTVQQVGTDHVSAINNPAGKVQANNQTRQACDAAKSGDVEIYTIALQVTDGGTRDLLEGCATSNGHAFTAQTEAELIAAFENIGRELGRLRLTN